MPIVFEQPKPFSGGLYSADAIYRGLPALAGAYESAGRIAMGRQQMLQEGSLQEMGIRAQVGNANAARMQDDRQFHDTAVYRSREQGADLAARAASQTASQNHEAGMQAQRFELASWLSQQELSQKEVLQLQQEKRAVAEVMSSPLSAEDKTDLILQLRTGIDAKSQRMKAMQAKAMTEQRETQALENKVQTELLNQRLAAMRGDFQYVVDPEKLHEVSQEMTDAGKGPRLMGNPIADAAAVAEFNKRVEDEARKRGLGAKWLKLPDGKMVMADDDKMRLQEQGKASSGKGSAPVEFEAKVQKGIETISKWQADWEANYAKAKGEPPSAQLRADNMAEMVKNYQQMEAAVRQIHGGDAKAQAAQAKTQVIDALEARGGELTARQDLPPEVKGRAMRLLGEAKRLIARYGPFEQMTNDDIKGRVKAIQEELNVITATPPAQIQERQRLVESLTPRASVQSEDEKRKEFIRKYGPYRDASGKLVTE